MAKEPTENQPIKQQQAQQGAPAQLELAALSVDELLLLLEEELLLQEEGEAAEGFVAKLIFALSERNLVNYLQLIIKLLDDYFETGELKSYSLGELRAFVPLQRSRLSEHLKKLKELGVLRAPIAPLKQEGKEEVEPPSNKIGSSNSNRKYQLRLEGGQKKQEPAFTEETKGSRLPPIPFVQRVYEAYKYTLVASDDSLSGTRGLKALIEDPTPLVSSFLKEEGGPTWLVQQQLTQELATIQQQLTLLDDGEGTLCLPTTSLLKHFVKDLVTIFAEPELTDLKDALQTLLQKNIQQLLGLPPSPPPPPID